MAPPPRSPPDSVPEQIKALPRPIVRKQAPVDLNDWDNVTAKPEDEIVIVSVGELGPWGSGRTRFEAELGIHSDGSVDLSAGAVLELAWNMGLVELGRQPEAGLVRHRRQPRARRGHRRALP